MIRKMELDDIFRIEALEKEVFQTTLGASCFHNELTLNPFSQYFVSIQNDMVIGYIGSRIYDDALEMMNFLVDTNYQNSGFGQELFDYIMEYIKDFNIQYITLEVRKSNTRAKRFYMKNGFMKSHIRKEYYDNEDAIVYIKEVK